MIGEMYEKLPVEVVMNILKFTPHPIAEEIQLYISLYAKYLYGHGVDEDYIT
jgi:hypothetical protein